MIFYGCHNEEDLIKMKALECSDQNEGARVLQDYTLIFQTHT